MKRERVANSDNARSWWHLVRGRIWTIFAIDEDEAIDLLFSLAAQTHNHGGLP